jgi:hypothetical protein
MNKATLLLLFQFFILNFCLGQILSLEEKKPVLENGIEYGFSIKNEQIKSAKGEEYSRYEITLYATNKTGCSKLYADRKSLLSGTEDPNLIATFTCNNANGKRLTAKGGKVRAREFYITANVTENGKEVSKSVKAGFLFRNNETIKDNIIVLVPKGERPIIECTVNIPQEL